MYAGTNAFERQPSMEAMHRHLVFVRIRASSCFIASNQKSSVSLPFSISPFHPFLQLLRPHNTQSLFTLLRSHALPVGIIHSIPNHGNKILDNFHSALEGLVCLRFFPANFFPPLSPPLLISSLLISPYLLSSPVRSRAWSRMLHHCRPRRKWHGDC